MTEPLAQSLADQQLASTDALRDALERQILLGGSLDTNLLETDVVSEEHLVEAMGAAFSMPTAGKADIDRIGNHIPRLFPLVFAETYHLVPYHLSGQDLSVLVSRPADEALYQRIHERLQLRVQPVVTTEVRLRYAMHRLYGTELLPRYRSLIEKLDGTAPTSAADKTAGHVLSWGIAGSPAPKEPAAPGRNGRAIDVGAMLAKLASANDRDLIVDILLDVTTATFQFAAIFLVQGDQVAGWRGSDAEATQRVARISLPIELPSVFQTIYATHGHYLGPLPTNSVNTRLLEDLGRQPPRTAFLAPILVGGKLAAILYGDNGPRGVPSKRVAAILLLTHRAGMCLQALIQKRKAAASNGRAPVATAIPNAAPDPGTSPVADARNGPAVPASDDSFEPLVERDLVRVEEPPPLPTVRRAEGKGDAEEDQSAVWQSVQIDELDSATASGDFRQDASPEAAEADFKRGIEDALAAEPEELPVEIEVDATTERAQEDSSYIAFADVDQSSPEAAVSEWEDVFVETVGSDRPVASEEALDSSLNAAPPAVSWLDVVAEAEAAPDPAAAARASVQVAGTQMDEREMLLDSLTSTDTEVWKSALPKLLELGTAIDEIVSERFPGEIRFDPFAPHINLPPFSRCSGLTALLTARGTSGAPIVLPHLESNDRVERFFAIYFLYAVRYPAALELLARRIYDSEPRNRYLAADALRVYRTEPAYRRIVQSLRDHLKIPVVEAQVATVQVLGQLRDPSSVPSLIPLVVSPRQALARASASALTVICAQSFRANVAQWAEWWQTHFNKPREAWLVEGMRHHDPGIRRIAAREFQLLTGRASPTSSSAVVEPAERRPTA